MKPPPRLGCGAPDPIACAWAGSDNALRTSAAARIRIVELYTDTRLTRGTARARPRSRPARSDFNRKPRLFGKWRAVLCCERAVCTSFIKLEFILREVRSVMVNRA